MSNFNFLPAQWKQMEEAPQEAEMHVYCAHKIYWAFRNS